MGEVKCFSLHWYSGTVRGVVERERTYRILILKRCWGEEIKAGFEEQEENKHDNGLDFRFNFSSFSSSALYIYRAMDFFF